MIQALHTAGLGMIGEQKYLDTTSNNIANIYTYGYKKERLNFKDAMYVNMLDASNRESGENLKKGTGVVPSSISKIYHHGPMIETGRNLDTNLINDRSFFVVENYNGEQVYTRDGFFTLSNEEDGSYLVNSNGNYILDENYNRIRIDVPESQINIDISGNITNDDGEVAAKLAVVQFPSTAGLENIGGNNYAATEASGEPEMAEGDVVVSGYIESSNVDLAEEMMNVIRAQRAYQLSSRVLKTADEMEGVANSLRR